MYELKENTALDILIFVHDANGDPVTGLVSGDFTKRISKGGGAFANMTVTITEREQGFYLLPLSALHTDTLGVLSMYFTATGAMQVNVQFRVVEALAEDISAAVFPAGAIAFTYTVTSSSTLLPLEGVKVWISTDSGATNIIWSGDTDTFGVARDVNGNLPMLDAGTYYFWRQRAGYTFTDPDVEVVS